MDLYFVCPIEEKSFPSSDYFLEQGYKIVEQEEGTKKLQGIVRLRSGCPICGQDHTFQVTDLICPLSGGKSEE